ncbi:MAG: cation:dicarboxylase symporter family transporter [Proteobacteria bacterium]|nr:cation:dicarboxylase symporter family transporter [Pseudomonadota bacterium]
MFHKMPLLLLIIIIVSCLFGHVVPLEIKSGLYAISLSIKSVIITLLPFFIFGLLFKVMTTLAHRASKLILLTLAAVFCSNFISTSISHYVGIWVYHFDLSLILPQSATTLTPLWQFTLPKFIANDVAMFGGIMTGFTLSYLSPTQAQQFAKMLDKYIQKTLKSLTYIIPLFIIGFILKLEHDGTILMLIKDYAVIFALIGLAQFCYLIFMYFLINGRNAFFSSIRHMLPAAIAGFSTMSSAVAMPLTILGTEKNAANADIARSVIPATVNIHLVGDCFAIPILAFAILKSFGIEAPSFAEYLIFSLYFVLAKFSVAAVPGGGIIVMLPILENYLGFNPQMLSLITALYILFDPVITCANVFGNGGFAVFIDKLQRLFYKTQAKEEYTS